MDNGPELTANALRDWCRFSGAGTAYIEPGSPWENPFVESFASRFRDEVLAVEAFDSLPEAKIVIEDWRKTYNQLRPHSSLGWKTAAALEPRLEDPGRLRGRLEDLRQPDSHSEWTDERGPVNEACVPGTAALTGRLGLRGLRPHQGVGG
jgi:transposase InsO family protein